MHYILNYFTWVYYKRHTWNFDVSRLITSATAFAVSMVLLNGEQYTRTSSMAMFSSPISFIHMTETDIRIAILQILLIYDQQKTSIIGKHEIPYALTIDMWSSKHMIICMYSSYCIYERIHGKCMTVHPEIHDHTQRNIWLYIWEHTTTAHQARYGCKSEHNSKKHAIICQKTYTAIHLIYIGNRHQKTSDYILGNIRFSDQEIYNYTSENRQLWKLRMKKDALETTKLSPRRVPCMP